MKIQPEADNAITIILDDGSEFPMHHTIHGDRDRLFIHRTDGIVVEVRDGLEWSPIATVSMLRLTAKAEEKGE